MKLKNCDGCNFDRIIWKNHQGLKYCKTCWLGSPHSKKNKAPNNNINNRSSKKIEEDKIYSKLRKIFLEAHPMCQAALPGCTQIASDVHHKSLRGSNYLVVATWMALCRSYHSHVHLHPKQARELGLLE